MVWVSRGSLTADEGRGIRVQARSHSGYGVWGFRFLPQWTQWALWKTGFQGFGVDVGVCLQTKGWGIRVQARSHSGYGVLGFRILPQ